MSSPTLEILSGSLTGRTYFVDDEEFVIGRAADCHIVIPKRYISRQHARICHEDGDYIVDGLSEKNPVLVSHRPIREHMLSHGDVFEFCGIQFRFLLPTSSSSPGRRGGSTSGWKDAAEDSWRDDDPPPQPRSRGSRAASFEDAAEDSWRDDAPPPQPRSRGSRAASCEDAAEDSWRDDDPSDDDPSDDSWSKPVESGWSGEASEESSGDSWASPRPQAGKKGSRASGVVFGADAPEEDDGEGTRELTAQALSNLSSNSGGRDGAEESSNERTAELDKGPGDLDDPDYDPFAEVEATKKKVRKVDPVREKTLKVLMGIGFCGILLAAWIYLQATEKKEWRELGPGPNPIRVAVGQTVRFVEPWSRSDVPTGVGYTNLAGRPNGVYKDAVAEVEWAVPHVKGRAIFLIQGLEEGTTQFTLRYERSRRIKRFEILVEGEDGHDAARDKRRAELRQKNGRRLLEMLNAAKASGDTFKSRRDFTGKETYYREALLQFELAADVAAALRAKGGARNEKTVREAEDTESEAREDYEKFVDRALANYRDLVTRGEPSADRVAQLKRVLRGINHVCDVRYKRLTLILNESYGSRLDTDGSEQCEQQEVK